MAIVRSSCTREDEMVCSEICNHSGSSMAESNAISSPTIPKHIPAAVTVLAFDRRAKYAIAKQSSGANPRLDIVD